MSQINKLQLIDVSKLNEVLDYLKSNNDTDKILQGIKNKDEFELGEKNKDMERFMKNNQKERIGESMVEFLKKKEKIKRKYDDDNNDVNDDNKKKNSEKNNSNNKK